MARTFLRQLTTLCACQMEAIADGATGTMAWFGTFAMAGRVA
jgi:hypothetical protein